MLECRPKIAEETSLEAEKFSPRCNLHCRRLPYEKTAAGAHCPLSGQGTPTLRRAGQSAVRRGDGERRNAAAVGFGWPSDAVSGRLPRPGRALGAQGLAPAMIVAPLFWEPAARPGRRRRQLSARLKCASAHSS
jgi:hypothetical protein